MSKPYDNVEDFCNKYGIRDIVVKTDSQEFFTGAGHTYSVSLPADLELRMSMDAFRHLVDSDNAGQEEQRMRDKYPAIKDAYDKYKMLLELHK